MAVEIFLVIIHKTQVNPIKPQVKPIKPKVKLKIKTGKCINLPRVLCLKCKLSGIQILAWTPITGFFMHAQICLCLSMRIDL